MISNREAGISAARSRAASNGTAWSSRAWTTSVGARILIAKSYGGFEAVAKKFCADPNRKTQIRKTRAIHDRHIFVDGRCFIVGQSLKDAAVKKPTYFVEMKDGVDGIQMHYETVWHSASSYPPPPSIVAVSSP